MHGEECVRGGGRQGPRDMKAILVHWGSVLSLHLHNTLQQKTCSLGPSCSAHFPSRPMCFQIPKGGGFGEHLVRTSLGIPAKGHRKEV